MYGTSWCNDTKRARKFLEDHGIPYQYIDVDHDEAGLQLTKTINNGHRVVPTIVFPDGSYLVEPDNAELAKKLGLSVH
jgi:glutaredoxin